MSLLTIFTAPKPFTNPHIALIQRNAIQSWIALGIQVRVIVVGSEAGMAEALADLAVLHLPDVRRNSQGTPFVSSIFALARQASDSPLLAYINADILLLPDCLQAAEQARQQENLFLVVGRRWDLAVNQPIDFSAGWDDRLRGQLRLTGRLHVPAGSDYFVFPRECFTELPDFAIGRAGWDNWMIYAARRQAWKVIDATQSLTVIHQDHDYSHLPGGQPHYSLPETDENIRLAGGRRAIFDLRDADRVLAGGQLRRPKMSWRRFWREFEIAPLVAWHSFFFGQLFFAIFHPIRAYGELRANLHRLRLRARA
jgi:hypothetical protein